MRRLLTAFTLLLTVLACSPVAGGPTSKPDPRLGISVHESSAQVFGRAPDYGSGAHALRSRNSLALSPTGDAFVAVRDASGAEVLAPNDRLEALLRLNSPQRRWDDPDGWSEQTASAGP